MIWNLFPFKGDFTFGKSQTGHQIWAVGRLSHLGDLLFHKKTALDVMHEWAHCHDEAAKHQLPTAAAFWIIQIVFSEECSSFTQNLMQIRCSPQSVWMPQPHSTHAHSTGWLLPPLTSIVKSSLLKHVHSSPLSLAARLHRWSCNSLY